MTKRKPSEDGVNKSAAIRELIRQHPVAKSKEIVGLLSEKGIKVSEQLVYYVKGRQANKGKKIRQSAAGKRAHVGSVELILQVKKLAGECGGYENLREMVDVLSER